MMPKYFLPEFVYSWVARAGERAKPRVVPVPLAVGEDGQTWALYTTAQGKRPGSKADFTDSFRIGGLFVFRGVPPAAGLLKHVPVPDVDMLALRDHYDDWAHWAGSDINQVLLTNGRLWFALVCDAAGKMRVREAFAAPDTELSPPFADRFGNYGNADDPVPFQERVFRALIPWMQLDAPEYLGVFLASHVRSYAHALAADPARAALRTRYAQVLERDLGLTVTGTDREAVATRHLVAQLFLRGVGEAVAKAEGIELAAVPPPAGWYADFDVLPVRDGFLGGVERYDMDPFHIVAGRLRAYGDPTRVAAFGRAFWRAVNEDDHACDRWNDLPGPVMTAHLDHLERRLSEQVPLLENLGNPRLHVLDPHAGVGLTLAPLLAGGPGRAALAGPVFAFEADPVKFQLLRLQALLALARRKRDHDPATLPIVHLALANPPVTPSIFNRLPDAPAWLIAGDLRFADSAGMESVRPAKDLTAHYQARLRDQWHVLTFDAEDPFVQYAALLENFTSVKKAVIAGLLFTPGRWLEADAFASVRETLLHNMDRVWLNRLPDALATHTQARKDGLASLLSLRLLPDRRRDRLAEASAQGIAYAEDIPAALAGPAAFRPLSPTVENRFTLAPARTSVGYDSWPSLRELSRIAPLCGPAERRNFATIRLDRDELAAAMRAYFNPAIPDDELARQYPEFMEDAPRFDARKTRARLLRQFVFDDGRIAPFPFKPFDTRWAYLENLRRLIKEPGPELQKLARIPGNRFLLAAEPNDRAPEGLSAWFSDYACDYDFFMGAARHFPLYIENEGGNPKAAASRKSRAAAKTPAVVPNLSDRARIYLDRIHPQINAYDDKVEAILAQQKEEGPTQPHRRENLDELLWYHALAVLFTPTYQQENGEALRRDWPRIPIPHWNDPEKLSWPSSALRTFAAQGRRIAELLSMKPLDPNEWPQLDTVAVLTTTDGHTPTSDELRVSNAWLQKSKGNAIRPGKGVTNTRPYTPKEIDELTTALHNYHLEDLNLQTIFGPKTTDVYLNETTYWRNIPQTVWTYELGGHQILRKWLSYRAEVALQRPLTQQEHQHFTQIAQYLIQLILIAQRLDLAWPDLQREATTQRA